MTETTVREGVCRVGLADGRWLVTGPGGGYRRADAAYNVTVPQGFDREDLAAYVRERRQTAGFGTPGPGLLTGVAMSHARGARADGVVAVATAGLSNPVGLGPDGRSAAGHDHAGTVNLLVTTRRALADGALATLLGVVVEVKTATLQAETGFTGTTSDAVAVGCVPGGEPAAFAGSVTPVGAAARACVRAALREALVARGSVPDSVDDAEHGTTVDRSVERFEP